MTRAQSLYDVVIVGAGTVGCVTALLLSRALPDLRIALVERQHFERTAWVKAPEQASDQDSRRSEPESMALLWSQAWRVSALSLSARAILSELGVWSSLVERGVCPYHDMRLTDADGTGQFALSARDAGEPCLGYIVENDPVCQLLRERCSGVENITCLTGFRVSGVDASTAPSCVRVLCVHDAVDRSGVAPQVLETRLLISAEGRASTVRELSGFVTRRLDYGQSAIVCQVQTRQPHGWAAWQDFHEEGPLAFLPLTQRQGFDPALEMAWPEAGAAEKACSIVWSLPRACANQWVECETIAPFVQALNRVIPVGLGLVERSSPLMAFPVTGHHVTRLIQPGIVLLGDAAHGYHPMAGQGLNIGLLDAAVLIDQLALSAERWHRFDHPRALRSFERSRVFQQQSVFALTTRLHTLYGHKAWWLRLGRNVGLNVLNQSNTLKKIMIHLANGHRTDLPERYRAALAMPLF